MRFRFKFDVWTLIRITYSVAPKNWWFSDRFNAILKPNGFNHATKTINNCHRNLITTIKSFFHIKNWWINCTRRLIQKISFFLNKSQTERANFNWNYLLPEFWEEWETNKKIRKIDVQQSIIIKDSVKINFVGLCHFYIFVGWRFVIFPHQLIIFIKMWKLPVIYIVLWSDQVYVYDDNVGL